MRGVFVNSGLDLVVETHGESWAQGDKISGVATINKSSGTPKIILGYGIIKKVRAKERSGWAVISSVDCHEKGDHKWSFDLSEDCMITDKSGSLFLLCGEGDAIENYGLLQLTVNPHKVISEYLNVFETFLKFKVKQIKGEKDHIKVKIDPPISNDYKSIEALDLKIRFSSGVLKITYSFKVKKLVTNTSGDMAVINDKKDFEQELTAKEYHCYGGSPNFETIQAKIKEVIEQANPKFFLQK